MHGKQRGLHSMAGDDGQKPSPLAGKSNDLCSACGGLSFFPDRRLSYEMLALHAPPALLNA